MQKITFLRSGSSGSLVTNKKKDISTQVESLSSGRLCGFLHKEGGSNPFGSTKRRWFSLEGRDLVYYIQPGDTKSLGFIHIPSISKIYKKNERCFVLVTPKREWILYAPSKEKADFWMKGIEINVKKNTIDKVHNQHKRDPHSNPEINLNTFKAPTPLKPNLQNSEKAVRFERKPNLANLRKSKEQDKKLSSYLGIEHKKSKLRKLKNDKVEKENEEVKLLLKSLTFTRPFPESEIAEQTKFENELSEIEQKIVSCEADIAVANTELQYGMKGSQSYVFHDRRRRRMMTRNGKE